MRKTDISINCLKVTLIKFVYEISRDFHAGSVIKNPPANIVDIGLIPGLGRSHRSTEQSNSTYAPQLLSLYSTPREVTAVRSQCN